MVTESPLKMISGLGLGGDHLIDSNGDIEESYTDGFAKELGMLLRDHQPQYEMNERERELFLYRSGSAPPSVEGSLAAVGGLFSQSNTTPGPNFGGNGKSGSFMSEEELRSDPAYLAYYYSHVNLNPRLPPPILSREDWRSAHRLQSGAGYGGIGDRRKLKSFDDGNSKSLFSSQLVLPTHKEETESLDTHKQSHGCLVRQSSTDWVERGADGLIGLSTGGLGSRRKSLADLLQEDLGRSALVSRNHSRSASRAAYEDGADPGVAAEAQLANFHNGSISPLTVSDMAVVEGLCSRSGTPCLARVQSLGSQSSNAFASAVGTSLSRSQTPDPHFVGTRSASPLPPTVGGRFGMTDKQKTVGPESYNGVSSSVTESEEFVAALSSLRLSSDGTVSTEEQQEDTQRQKSRDEFVHTPLFTQPLQQGYTGLNQSSGALGDHNIPSDTSGAQTEGNPFPQHSGSFASNLYVAGGGVVPNVEGPNGHYQNAHLPSVCTPNYGMNGYPVSPMLPSLMGNYLAPNALAPAFDNVSAASTVGAVGIDSGTAPSGLPGGSTDLHNLYRLSGQMGNGLQMPVFDPIYAQYFQRTADYATQIAASFSDPSITGNYMNGSYVDLLEFQKAYLASLFAQQKSQYGMPYLGKGGTVNSGYYCNPSFGLGMPYANSPLASPVLPSSPVARVSPQVRQSERSSCIPSGARSLVGGGVGSWQSENGVDVEENYGCSLLEDFKSSKTRNFELSEISGSVVEFRYPIFKYYFCHENVMYYLILTLIFCILVIVLISMGADSFNKN
eukprot:Gb_31285 [translate_table: standard]